MGNNQPHGASTTTGGGGSASSGGTSSSSSSSYSGSYGFEGEGDFERGRKVNYFLWEAARAHGSPASWSEAQLRAFVEVCSKNRILDVSDSGLTLVEIRSLLQACQNDLIERAEKYIAKKYRKIQKQQQLLQMVQNQKPHHKPKKTSSLRSFFFSGHNSNNNNNNIHPGLLEANNNNIDNININNNHNHNHHIHGNNIEIHIEEYDENEEVDEQHNAQHQNANHHQAQVGIEDILIADPELYAIVSGKNHKERNKNKDIQRDEVLNNYFKKRYKYSMEYYIYFYQNNMSSKKDEKRTITQIVLRSNNLKYIPREMCHFFGISSKLTKLDLSNNNIQHLPSSITTLTHLEFLDLSGNKLVCIPKEIGELASLKKLYLNNNKLNCLPFQILSLGRASLILKADSNPWFIPGQLSSVNECLRDHHKMNGNNINGEHNTPRRTETVQAEANNTVDANYPLQQPSNLLNPRLAEKTCPTLVQLCLQAVDKYDICWEAVEELLPSDIRALLLVGPKTCDKCQRLLDTTRSQMSLIHFLTVFGCSHPLPFLYSTCSAECSRFILITSCILEFLRRL